MEVYTSDAVLIGKVKAVRDQEMLIDRSLDRDVFVPLAFVGTVIEPKMRVELMITNSAFRQLQWDQPPRI